MYQTQIEFVKDLDGKLKSLEGGIHKQLNKIDNLKADATEAEVVTAFNSLLADLKAKGLMKSV